MNRRTPSRRLLATFSDDRRGSVAILFGFLVIPLMLAIGVAVDYGRGLNMKTRLGHATDAAALAVGSWADLSDDEVQEKVEAFFAANYPPEELGTVVQINVASTAATVTISASGVVDTAIMRIVGINSMDVGAHAEVSKERSKIELGMMLDVTGSMGGQKMDDLKTAAKDLVDILLADGLGLKKARIGLAPYSAAVNAGVYSDSVSDSVSVDGCVFEREGFHAYDDFAPSAGYFLGAMPDPGSPNNWKYGCPRGEVLPITDDKAILKNTINSYRTGGWTAGHLGVAWAWYLISPNWSSIWPAASSPDPYSEKKTLKAVILMTDGEFNT
ncbi:MAG: pilus assembly protein TadG-related protein, partial [Methyloligellaceae bacterium]